MDKMVLKMNRIAFFIIVLLTFVGCHRGPINVSSESVPVAASATPAYEGMEQLIEPYKAAMGKQMDSLLCYSPVVLDVARPEGLLNDVTADIMLARANRIMPTDMAITNVGGLRKPIEAGEVTLRDIYEVMPFDNMLVIVELQGEDLLALCDAIVAVGGEAVAGLTIVAHDGQLKEAKVQGVEIDPSRSYSIATSDYLSAGNDKLTPLGRHSNLVNTNLLLRDIFIEGFAANDTIRIQPSNRMIVE